MLWGQYPLPAADLVRVPTPTDGSEERHTPQRAFGLLGIFHCYRGKKIAKTMMPRMMR